MSRTLLRHLAAALSTLLGALVLCAAAGAAPAAADSVTVTDPRHDVWLQKDFANNGPWSRVPDRARDDLTSVRASLRPHRLVITTAMAEIPKKAGVLGAGPQHTIVRSQGDRLQVYVDVSSGRPSVSVYQRGIPVTACEGRESGVRTDRARGVLVVVLTDACLGSQDWVRVATIEANYPGTHRRYADAVGNRGHGKGTLTRKIHAG